MGTIDKSGKNNPKTLKGFKTTGPKHADPVIAQPMKGADTSKPLGNNGIVNAAAEHNRGDMTFNNNPLTDHLKSGALSHGQSEYKRGK